jgi:hypothetical protein
MITPCPNCHANLEHTEAWCGHSVACPSCGQTVHIGELEPPTLALPNNTIPPPVLSSSLKNKRGIAMIVGLACLGVIVLGNVIGGLFHNSDNVHEPTVTQDQVPPGKVPAPPKASEIDAQKFTPAEIQIHDYSQTIGDDYQTRFGIEKGEALTLIAASKEFKRPIIEVARVYDLIENSKLGWKISPAELDIMNIKRFKDIGFQQRDGAWYYGDETVNMGTPLPTPESMKPAQPDEGKKLEVTLEAQSEISDLKTLQIKGKTNLPDGTKLMIHLSCPEIGYDAGDPAIVANGKFETSWFSNSTRTLNRLEDGKYVLEISTPTVSVHDESVKKVLGENGRNMTGKLIQFDEVLGKCVRFSKTINVQ